MKPHTKKKQVLVFTLAPPLPAVAGGDIYAVNALIPFASEIDYHLFCFIGDDNDKEKIERYKKDYHLVFRSIHLELRPLMPFQMPKVRRALRLIRQAVVGLPFIDASYESSSAVNAARRIVRERRIDAIEINSAHLAFFKRYLSKVPALLISHNIESDIFPFWMPPNLSGWKKRFMEWIAGRSRRAARAVELENSFGFEAMTFISREDMARVKANVPKFLMPLSFPRNGISYSEKPVGVFNVLWMGGFGWYPNTEGVLWFIREIFPKIKNLLEGRGIVLHFCGSNPPNELRALHDGRHVQVHGFVDDISSMVNQAHLLIVPLLSGAGIRVKIVEAMSMGVPVLSTTKGCEGIGAIDKKNILVRDDPHAFADALLMAASDRALMKGLAEAGLDLMNSEYSEHLSLDAKRHAYEKVKVL